MRSALRRAASLVAHCSVLKSLRGSPRHSSRAASYAARLVSRTSGPMSSPEAAAVAARARRIRLAKSMASTVVRVNVRAVAHAFARDQIWCVVRLQAAAQLGNPDLQCIRRIDWQARLRPEPVDEHRGGDGPARLRARAAPAARARRCRAGAAHCPRRRSPSARADGSAGHPPRSHPPGDAAYPYSLSVPYLWGGGNASERKGTAARRTAPCGRRPSRCPRRSRATGCGRVAQ